VNGEYEYDPEDLNKLQWMFNSEDISELDGIFTNIIEDDSKGFVMEFIISILAAKELTQLYVEASLGNEVAQQKCWHEYSKIIAELTKALNDKLL
jgi:hypothetical protein